MTTRLLTQKLLHNTVVSWGSYEISKEDLSNLYGSQDCPLCPSVKGEMLLLTNGAKAILDIRFTILNPVLTEPENKAGLQLVKDLQASIPKAVEAVLIGEKSEPLFNLDEQLIWDHQYRRYRVIKKVKRPDLEGSEWATIT